MTATARQMEANRRNAERSTGPRTEEGKEASRRNAMKHGLLGTVVLPVDEADEVARRVEVWNERFRPSSEYEGWLVEYAAGSSVRISSCRTHDQLVTRHEALRARDGWNADRRIEAEELASSLARHPAKVAAALKGTFHGRELLIGRWTMLARVIENGRPWDEGQQALALNLMGVPAEFRDGLTAKPAAELSKSSAEVCLATARGEIARLSDPESQARLAAIDLDLREKATLGASPSPSANVRRIRRYEAVNDRRMLWALEQLALGRGEEAAPESPKPAATAAPSRPAKVELGARPMEAWAVSEMTPIEPAETVAVRAHAPVATPPPPPPVPTSMSGNRRARKAALARLRAGR